MPSGTAPSPQYTTVRSDFGSWRSAGTMGAKRSSASRMRVSQSSSEYATSFEFQRMLTGLMTPPPHQVPKKYSTKRCELRLIMPTRSPRAMPSCFSTAPRRATRSCEGAEVQARVAADHGGGPGVSAAAFEQGLGERPTCGAPFRRRTEARWHRPPRPSGAARWSRRRAPWPGHRRRGAAEARRGRGLHHAAHLGEGAARHVVRMLGASSQSSTGAKQASLPSSSAHHSSRVRVRNTSAMRSLSSGQRSASICASKAGSSAMPQRSRSSA